MATLEGFEIKNVKTIHGWEESGIACSIYLDGVRVMSYLQDTHGGSADYEFLSNRKEGRTSVDTEKLVKERMQVFQQYDIFCSMGFTKHHQIVDSIVNFLRTLNDIQKTYMKKKHKNLIIPFLVYTLQNIDTAHEMSGSYMAGENYLDFLDVAKAKYPECWLLPITSIGDFNVTLKSFIN